MLHSTEGSGPNTLSHIPLICALRVIPFGKVKATCAHKRRARASRNQTGYSLTSPNTTCAQSHFTTPSQFNTHQWISLPRSSPFKVSLTLPRLSPLLPLPSKPPSMVAAAVVASSRRRFLGRHETLVQ